MPHLGHRTWPKPIVQALLIRPPRSTRIFRASNENRTLNSTKLILPKLNHSAKNKVHSRSNIESHNRKTDDC